jgi:hypothetical protein
LNIVYYTSGITGVGRVVRGIAIGNALKRNNVECNYSILHSSEFSEANSEFDRIKIPPETLENLNRQNYKKSHIYNALQALRPDILLVDLLWFPLHFFIEELNCVKIFLCRQVDKHFFTIPTKQGTLLFNKKQYDHLLAIEPFSPFMKMRFINPIVIRNHTEILNRKQALERLELVGGKKVCCIAYSGHPGDFEKVKRDYSYLEEEYEVIHTSTYHEGIFPIVDYFNAIDLLVCGVGYNAFWEAKYFQKQAAFVPTHTRFESQEWRIENCQDYKFDENGADQLVHILMDYLV